MATPPDFTAGQVLTAAQMNAVGLWLVKKQTIGSAVSSVTVTDAFSADYKNYKVLINGGVASTNMDLRLTFGASAANYYWSVAGTSWAGAASNTGGSNVAFIAVGQAGSSYHFAQFDVFQPFTSQVTFITGALQTNLTGGTAWHLGGFHNSAVSYTDFTITCSTGNITGGTIEVYGYRN